MASYQELCESFERQVNHLREQLAKRDYKELITSAELFATVIRVKVNEIDKDGGSDGNV